LFLYWFKCGVTRGSDAETHITTFFQQLRGLCEGGNCITASKRVWKGIR